MKYFEVVDSKGRRLKRSSASKTYTHAVAFEQNFEAKSFEDGRAYPARTVAWAEFASSEALANKNADSARARRRLANGVTVEVLVAREITAKEYRAIKGPKQWWRAQA